MIDAELEKVADAILALDVDGRKTAQILRDTFDQLYDGRPTCRYRWDQLYGIERKYIGPLVEMNLHREFNFSDGKTLDYCIAGIEVACQFSQPLRCWVIQAEALG